MKKLCMILPVMLGLMSFMAPSHIITNRTLNANTETTHSHEGWTAISKWSDLNSYLTQDTTDTSKYYLDAGNYYLSSTLILEKDIYIKGSTEIDFCLNGNLVTSKAKDTTSSYQFHLERFAAFNVYDDVDDSFTWYLNDHYDANGNLGTDGIFESIFPYQYYKNANLLYGTDYVTAQGGLFYGFQASVFYTEAASHLNINGTTFIANMNQYIASCIRTEAEAYVTLNDTSFIKNSGAKGGAIYAENNTELTLNNVTASYNEGNQGGFIWAGGKVNINGGTYTNNKSSSGSVISANYHTKLNITDGLFENNQSGSPTKPTTGGVIGYDLEVSLDLRFCFAGGTFRNNVTYTDESHKATKYGAYGVMTNYGADHTSISTSFGGDVVMQDNYVIDINSFANYGTGAVENNFKVFNYDGDKGISFCEDELAPKNGMSVGLTCMDVSEEGTVVISDADADYSAYFTSDIEGEYFYSSENGNSYALTIGKENADPSSSSVYPAPTGGDETEESQKVIVSLEKTDSKDGVDTFTITYSDGTTTTYTTGTVKESTSNVLPVIAIILSSVSIIGLGAVIFLLLKPKTK